MGLKEKNWKESCLCRKNMKTKEENRILKNLGTEKNVRLKSVISELLNEIRFIVEMEMEVVDYKIYVKLFFFWGFFSRRIA